MISLVCIVLCVFCIIGKLGIFVLFKSGADAGRRLYVIAWLFDRISVVSSVPCTLSQQTRDFDPMLFQCWPTVYDAGPTLNKHWANVSCLLGYHMTNEPNSRHGNVFIPRARGSRTLRLC